MEYPNPNFFCAFYINILFNYTRNLTPETKKIILKKNKKPANFSRFKFLKLVYYFI